METKNLATTNNNESKALSFIAQESLQKYHEVDKTVSELLNSGLTGIAFTKAKVIVVKKIEALLDDEFMAEVMSLQNKAYGFKTDCDLKKNESYPATVVKDCVVQAILFGAEVTGNEFNILGNNMYLTKEYCENTLIKNKVWYKITMFFSKLDADSNCWYVPTKIEWIDPRDETKKKNSETLNIPVNKFEKTKEDTLRGQAKRDALYWLIGSLRGTPMPFGEITVDANYTEVTNHPITETKEEGVVVESSEQKDNQKEENKPVVDDKPKKVTPEQQAAFDKFISNREKYTDFDGLKKRAGVWCNTNKITSAQLDMTTFEKIRDELIMPK